MAPDVVPVPFGRPTFLDAPRCADLAALDADVAVLGVPYGVPYDMEGSRAYAAPAPGAIRAASLRYVPYLGHYDVDFGGELFAEREVRIVDCGDVAMAPGRYAENAAATTAAVRAILDRGALPVVLGGDHSISIPVSYTQLRAH
ncbi:MAG: arginase family protein, partial [Thermomicrobiaceae bacterium]|nr:arginase family protein [Thermomicrobiaceae bacterium]